MRITSVPVVYLLFWIEFALGMNVLSLWKLHCLSWYVVGAVRPVWNETLNDIILCVLICVLLPRFVFHTVLSWSFSKFPYGFPCEMFCMISKKPLVFQYWESKKTFQCLVATRGILEHTHRTTFVPIHLSIMIATGILEHFLSCSCTPWFLL